MAEPSAADQGAWPVFRRLIGYVSDLKLAFTIAFLAMALDAGMDAAFAMLLEPLIEDGFIERDEDVIRLLPPVLLGIFFLRGLAAFIYGYIMAWIGRRAIHRMRADVFGKYLVLPTRSFDAATGGGLLSKITFDIEQIAQATSNVVIYLVRDSLKVIALMAVMFYNSWKLALVILFIGPIIAWLVDYVSVLLRRHSASIQESMGDVTRVAEEAIEGNRVVKIFGGRAYEEQRFGEVNDENRRSNMRLELARFSSDAIVQWIAGLGMTAIIWIAVAMIEISTGDMIAFLSAMLLLMAPLKRLTNLNASLQKGIAAARSVFEVLDRESEDRGGERRIVRARGALSFQGLGFTYDREKGPVLHDLDLEIEPGMLVALVGRSGSGKSTLANLVPRLYDPDQGRILLDGHPLADYDLNDLRRQVALVSQDVKLFNDTIAANIAYGGLADASRAEIEEAARVASVLDFTDDLPQGLETMVGDRGVLLSGGQRQRIALARALLKDAPVLILDEASSALDSETERRIQEATAKLLEGRTTLAIAHRLSTVDAADLVVVMRDGRIVEMGSYDEVLALDGEFAALRRLQFDSD